MRNLITFRVYRNTQHYSMLHQLVISGVTRNSELLDKYPNRALPPLSIPYLPLPSLLATFHPLPISAFPFLSLPTPSCPSLPSFSSLSLLLPTLFFPFPPSSLPYNS